MAKARLSTKPPPPLPTYEEIARRAGVSPKTVCNVFRSPDLVRAKTSAKVLRAIRQLGVNDPAVFQSRLRAPRKSAARWLLCLEYGVAPAVLGSPVYTRILGGAEARARELGWQLGLSRAEAGVTINAALRGLDGEGVLFFGPRCDGRLLDAKNTRLPVVGLLGPAEVTEWDVVDYDRREVARIAVEHLRAQGCRRLAYLGSPLERAKHFADAAHDAGLLCTIVVRPDLFLTEGREQATNLASLRSAWRETAAAKPDGLFVYSDQLTNALYGVLATEGIRPRRDLAIVSCNAETAFLAPLDPRPPSIDIHPDEIGRRAVDLLVWRLDNPRAARSVVTIRPRLKI